MSPQIFLLTGKNAYLLAEERHRWIQGFRDKHGAENCSRVEGDALTYPHLLDEISVLPFTARKRLVIVEGVPAFEKEEVERLPKDIHPDVLLLFIDPSPDRRKSGVKALFAIADVRECQLLAGAALEGWIRDAFVREGVAILPDALRALVFAAGTEQIVLQQEIAKLALYAGGKPVTRDDVDTLVLPSGERNVWQLIDLLVEGDAPRTLGFVKELTSRGETTGGLWAMLLWIVAQLTAVAAAVQDGARSPQDVMKKSGMKFGTARGLLPIARRMNHGKLQGMLGRFAQADIDLKTGGLRSTAEAPQEAEAILDVCLAELCKC
ncbi:DNA polymerase III subunit delta [Candidatus Peribacteria bacterium RIFCSPHIGHO2_02_FULL_53_20]|nr:MAG: DNA polymerase III subunit delta [Candidatus Peribacteria bacterium RIFCSPHIGHO2_02_FULL_53_20]